MAQSPAQRDLTIAFVILSLLFGSFFSLIHFILGVIGRQPMLLSYTPYVIGGAFIIYFFHFRHRIKAVRFLGAGKITVPTVYFMGIVLAPGAFLNLTAPFTDFVVELASVEELSTTQALYVHIRNFYPVNDKVIDRVTTSSSTDDDEGVVNNFYYRSFVPLTAKEGDTVYSTWMKGKSKTSSIKGKLTDEAREEFRVEFLQACHAAHHAYTSDSIDHFSVEQDSDLAEMLVEHGEPTAGNIILYPSPRPLGEIRAVGKWIFGTGYLVLLIFFWGAVALGHLEEIIND